MFKVGDLISYPVNFENIYKVIEVFPDNNRMEIELIKERNIKPGQRHNVRITDQFLYKPAKRKVFK